jgi:hypothetical protein
MIGQPDEYSIFFILSELSSAVESNADFLTVLSAMFPDIYSSETTVHPLNILQSEGAFFITLYLQSTCIQTSCR